MNPLTSAILAFYDREKRILPWRDQPTPYHVYVSEIMLQQTRVETVIPYYERFIETLPDLSSLAYASEDVLNKLWQGLGYYSRVKNMQKAAQLILQNHQGKLPSRYEDLIQLPGIGPYTAGAICSIAYHQNRVAIDGNVLRVFSRLMGLREDPKEEATFQTIENKVRELYPEGHSSEFTQALMEIGAIICLPNGEPLCEQCPLNSECVAKQFNLQNEIPRKTPKKVKPIELKTVVLFRFQEKIAIQKRSSKGLLASLYELPNWEGHLDESSLSATLSNENIAFSQIQPTISTKHVFTHKIWDMNGYSVILKELPKDSKWLFKSLDEIQKSFSIPSAFRAFLEE